MTSQSSDSQHNVWRRRFYLVIVAWLLTTFAMSFSPTRSIVAYPLYAHDAEASGEAVYVMAGGPAYWERLRAASDLYHWERTKRIIVLEEHRSDGYNFIRKQSDSRLQRSIDYLGFWGVPKECIESVPVEKSTRFGSLSEARGVARKYPDLNSLVVVTSAPHTRRSLLCFQRTLPDEVNLQIYSASNLQLSNELTSPLWIEYAKLIVYFFVA